MKNYLPLGSILAALVNVSACGGVGGVTSTSISASAGLTSSVGNSLAKENPRQLILAINLDAKASSIYESVEYYAERYALGGRVHATNDEIFGVSDGSIYQFERYGDSRYEITVSEGYYDIALHFAEIYYERANQRQINLSIEEGGKYRILICPTRVGHDVGYSVTFERIYFEDASLDGR